MRRSLERLFADRVLAVILLIGLAARLLFVASLENRLYWPIDEKAYDQLALSLVEGRGYVDESGRPTAYRPVGYPVFLALLYAVFGRSLIMVRIVQSLLTAALINVIYLLTLRLFDRRSARIAAAICALYPYYIYVSGVLYSEALCVPLFACAVYLFMAACDRPTMARFAMLGVSVGALVLIRPNLLATLPFFVVWYVAVPGVRQRVPLWMVGVLVVAATCTVTPWAARNYTRLGAFTLTTNGGRNFWLGNNPSATADTGNEVAIPDELATKLAQVTSEVEQDRIYYAAGLAFIRQHPQRFLRLAVRKALAFWRLYPVPSSGFKQNETLSKVASVVTFGPVLALAIFGLALSWPQAPRQNLAFLCLFVSFDLAHALYIAIVRLRLPVDALLMPFASFALGWLSTWRWTFARKYLMRWGKCVEEV